MCSLDPGLFPLSLFDQKTDTEWNFTLSARERAGQTGRIYILSGARSFFKKYDLEEGAVVAGFVAPSGKLLIGWHAQAHPNAVVKAALQTR